MKKRGGKIVFSEDPRPYLKKSKLFIISPGIPFTTDVVKKAREEKLEIIGEAEYASRLYKGHWVGITGTNGKTTTSYITRAILRKAGYEVKTKEFLRIGVPFTLLAVLVGYLFCWFIWS